MQEEVRLTIIRGDGPQTGKKWQGKENRKDHGIEKNNRKWKRFGRQKNYKTKSEEEASKGN